MLVSCLLSTPFGFGATAAEINGVTNGKIVFGATLPMTGPIADVGLASLHGGMAYFNDINAKGGVHGRKIEWIVEDDAYQPPRALAGARKLIESDKVFALFSSSGTNSSLAVLPYVKSKKIPWLFPYAGAKQFIEPVSPYVFGLFPNYEWQIATITEYLIKKKGAKHVAFVFANTLDNKVGVDAGVEVLKRNGLEPAAVVSYERGTSDFSSTILTLQNAKPDFIVESTTTTDVARLIQEGAARQFKPQWAGTATAMDPMLVRLIGDQAEGIIGTSPTVPPGSDEAAVVEFRESLKRSYPGDIPSAFNMYMYSAAKLLVHALELAGPDLTQEKLVAALESLRNYETGYMAPATYTPTNHMSSDRMLIVEFRKGQLETTASWTGAND